MSEMKRCPDCGVYMPIPNGHREDCPFFGVDIVEIRELSYNQIRKHQMDYYLSNASTDDTTGVMNELVLENLHG